MNILVKNKLPTPVHVIEGDAITVTVRQGDKSYVVATKSFSEDKGVFDTAFIAEGENVLGMRKVLFGGLGLE